MYVLILIIHILVAFALMAVVLMQSGKGRGLSGAFGGGGGNQTLFGGRGAVDFLGKATWILGGVFMVTSLTLAIMAGASRSTDAGGGLIPKDTSTAPMIPGAPGEGMPMDSQQDLPGQSPVGLPSGDVQEPVSPMGGETAPAPAEGGGTEPGGTGQ